MPRELTECNYRVVIHRECKRADGSDYSHELHYGPYAAKGTAKGVLTRELNWAENHKHLSQAKVTGWVELSTTKWEKVEENDG